MWRSGGRRCYFLVVSLPDGECSGGFESEFLGPGTADAEAEGRKALFWHYWDEQPKGLFFAGVGFYHLRATIRRSREPLQLRHQPWLDELVSGPPIFFGFFRLEHAQDPQRKASLGWRAGRRSPRGI